MHKCRDEQISKHVKNTAYAFRLMYQILDNRLVVVSKLCSSELIL
jgi:hypothetical protein